MRLKFNYAMAPPATRLRPIWHRLRHHRLYRLVPASRMQCLHSKVHHEAALLSPQEIALVLKTIGRLDLPKYTNNAEEDVTPEGLPVHCTTYLNYNDIFNKHFLWLKNRIKRLIERVDRKNNWGFDISSRKFNIRVAEYHEMEEGGSLSDMYHYDIGSLITVDIMLEGILRSACDIFAM